MKSYIFAVQSSKRADYSAIEYDWNSPENIARMAKLVNVAVSEAVGVISLRVRVSLRARMNRLEVVSYLLSGNKGRQQKTDNNKLNNAQVAKLVDAPL